MGKLIMDLDTLRGSPFRTNTSKLVWFCLIRDIGEDGLVHTSASGIAKEIGVNEKTVRNTLKSFTENGIIELVSPIQSPILSPILSPKKVRYMGCVIRLNGIDSYKDSQNNKIRKKSDTKSDIKSDISTTEITALTPEVKDPNEIDFDSFMRFFNESVSATAIPTIRVMTDKRKRLLRARIEDFGKKSLMDVIKHSVVSDFLNGRKTEWKADFDWIFKQENFIKILEGKYVNRTNQTTNQSSGRGQHPNPSLDDIAAAVYRRTHAGEDYR